MTGAELAGFLAASLLFIVTPGQDTALTVRNTIARGRAAGLATAGGVALGQVCWTVAAVGGITVLLLASEVAFVALKVAGAAYLVWLGSTMLVAAARRRPPSDPSHAAAAPSARGRSLRQGLLSNLANPKMAVFFGSFLPQWAPAAGGVGLQSAALGVAFSLMTLAWLSLYATALTALRAVDASSTARRALDAVCGLGLIAVAARMALADRP